MKKTKPYRFPLGHAPRPDLIQRTPSLQSKEKEVLTRQVQGQKASDLEERYAFAQDFYKIKYEFQYVTGAPKGMPGYNSLDFLSFHNGTYRATQVDDTTFIHKGSAAHDLIVDIKTMENLKKMGIVVEKINHVTQVDLSTRELALRYVYNTFLG